MAIEMALALEPDEPAPSRFTAWNRLTAWRADETLPRRRDAATPRCRVAARGRSGRCRSGEAVAACTPRV